MFTTTEHENAVSQHVLKRPGRCYAMNKEVQPGVYKMVLDAKGLTSGAYFYRLQAHGSVQNKKLTLRKYLCKSKIRLL